MDLAGNESQEVSRRSDLPQTGNSGEVRQPLRLRLRAGLWSPRRQAEQQWWPGGPGIRDERKSPGPNGIQRKLSALQSSGPAPASKTANLGLNSRSGLRIRWPCTQQCCRFLTWSCWSLDRCVSSHNHRGSSGPRYRRLRFFITRTGRRTRRRVMAAARTGAIIKSAV